MYKSYKTPIRVAVMLVAIVCVLVPVRAGASDTQRYVSPFGTDTGDCSTQSTPCATVQYAVGQSAAGDTINLAPGAYVEQVAITQSLTIIGAGRDDSTIVAPGAPLTFDAQGQTYIVAISGSSTTVSMSNLTVAGPGPAGSSSCPSDSGSLDKGITVFGHASLNLSGAAVRNIYNRPVGSVGGCQRGDAISIGSPCYSCTPDVGYGTLTRDLISVYQKNAVAVRGTGSTLTIRNSRLVNNPSPYIASNGIEVVAGAVGVASGNTITGNECNDALACTSNPFSTTQSESAGILSQGAGAGTSLSSNTLHGNDIGIYTDDGIFVGRNNANDNRYVGIYVDVDAGHGQFNNNTATSTTAGADEYGIIAATGSGNRFSNDTANGNSVRDMYYAGPTTDTNTYSSNHCGTASPNKAYWHCI